ncbi:esterase/lipase family protein [Streptomyces sp. JW3]|uniref:esterase/lipase family protein n=1 Tax=Streptomyces sp. JW3 TaxID=3456955 RepID=UPI003FA41D08
MAVNGRLGVVFIHGFLSSGETWKNFTARIAEDARLGFVDPLFFNYRSPMVSINPLRRIPSYEDIADDLGTYLSTVAEEYESLALVAHSQGGLIIQRYFQRMLGRGRGGNLSRIRQVVLFACPNNGSELARTWLHRNPQRRQLHVLNRQVSEAQSIVVHQVLYATEVRPDTCPIPITAFAGTEDNVVTQASAQSVFRDTGSLPGDHFTIIQPKTVDDRSHVALRQKLLAANESSCPSSALAVKGEPTAEAPTATSAVSETRERTPVVATKESRTPSDWRRHVLLSEEELIHVDDLVERLTGVIEHSSSASAIAVHGDGGLGKTAVTFAAVSRVAAAGCFTHVVWASARNTRFATDDPNSQAINHIYWNDLLSMLAVQIGCELSPSQALWEREFTSHLKNELGESRVLIVIDNLEFVAAADRVVERLRTLGIRPPHKIVATTRWNSERHDFDVHNIAVHPLAEQHTYDLARLAARGGNSDLQSARNNDLAPIYRITDGNPFLIKLIVSQYVASGKSLSRIIEDLAALPDEAVLAGRVRGWLFERSLDELSRRSSPHDALRLLFAFCANGRGGSMTYEDLASETVAMSPGLDKRSFDELLSSACRLNLLRPSDMNRKYSIHSLLYEHTCPASALRRDR